MKSQTSRLKRPDRMACCNRKAFTIIETLISVLLLGIILTGGMALYFNASAIMTLTTHKKIAMEMANQAMEQQKVAGYGSLPAGGDWVDMPAVTFGEFTAQMRKRVTDVEGSAPNANKRVDLEVEWFEADRSDPFRIRLATYMAPEN